MVNLSTQVPKLQVREKWYENLVNADTANIHDEILDAPPDGYEVHGNSFIYKVKKCCYFKAICYLMCARISINFQAAKGYVAVDPHILATPVVTDLNNDDRLEEMIIPVSYYFDVDQYR